MKARLQQTAAICLCLLLLGTVGIACAGEPDTGLPSSGEPDIGEPDMVEPDIVEPDIGLPPLGEPYLSPSQVWADAQALNGQQVRVGGWASFMIVQTAVKCIPAYCDCNKTTGRLELVEDQIERWSAPETSRISILDLRCRGNECTMSCGPFDPHQVEAFMLVGTLRYQEG